MLCLNQEDCSFTKVESGMVVYPKDDDASLSIVAINGTASLILEACKEGLDEEDIAYMLEEPFEVPSSCISSDLDECLKTLASLKVVMTDGR